jgi:uncharacterized OsmC-like protein
VNADGYEQQRQSLVEWYAEQPEAALITVRAEGTIGKTIACAVPTGRISEDSDFWVEGLAPGTTVLGLHAAAGGADTAYAPEEMFLQAMVASAGITLKILAIEKGVDLEGTIHAEGEVDFRGALGVDDAVPVGFAEVRMYFDFSSTASDGELDALLEEMQRRAPVLQTSTHPVRITVTRESS